MKPKFLAFPLSLVLASTAMAGQFIWTGATNSTWTNASNWDTTSTPPVSPDLFPALGGDYASDFLTIRNNGDLTAEVPGTNPGAGAVYNPGAGVTTTFRSGRGFVVGIGNGPGATPPNVKGRADLTITSGTIAAVRGVNSGSEPFMANRADVNLLINGGHLDLSQHLNNFRLIQEGFPGITSTITIDSGSLSCNLLDLYFDAVGEDPADRFGTGIINLNGGILALNRFNITTPPPAEQSSFKINLNGGILRARNTNANFLPDLPDTQVIVKSGGAIIDTNTFNSTIAAPLLHDPLLGESLDGGLTKNGRGNLTLSGTNTFNGGIIVNAGTALTEGSRIILGANNDSAGTGSITLADSYAELQLGVNRSIPNPLVVSDTGDEKSIYFVNAGASEYSGPITINESNINHFRVRSDVNCFFTLSGKISGPGGIYKFQSGAVYLTDSTNDFTGGAKISQGLLSFTSGALGTTGSILMDGGTLRWDPANDQDISSRLLLVDGKTATLTLAEQTDPSYDIANVTFANAIGNNSTAALLKNGPGTLTLTQASTYSGGSTLTQGILGFPAGGLGVTGAITMNGGTLRWQTDNAEDVSSRLVMVDAKTATFATNGNNVSFANAIGNSSTGNLTKNGSGILTLTGTNTYTGITTVTGGTLLVNGSLDAASVVNVTGGNLGGTGTVGGNVVVATVGNLAPGASAGTLTISGDLDISAMAGGAGKLRFELDTLAGPNDLLAIGGTLTIGSGLLGIDDLVITNLGGLQVGTYTLIMSGGISGSIDASSGPIATGFDGQLQTSGSDLQLVVTAAATNPYDTWSGGVPFDGDANGDGVNNGLAFLLGAASPNVSALDKLPAISQSGSGLVLTFKSLNAASRGSAVLTVEHSSNLGISDAWLGAVIPDTEGISGPDNGVTFNVTLGSPTNAVIATISSDQTATGKLFGRLKAENP